MRPNKHTLDRRTAATLGLKQSDVSTITEEFINQICVLLEEAGVLVIDNLGVLSVQVQERNTKTTLTVGDFRPHGKAGLCLEPRRQIHPDVKHMVKVHFRKSRALRDRLNERYRPMEKYGVDENTKLSSDALEKLANKGCPECGRPVQTHGSVLKCPVHGTEPFEEHPPKQNE